jgi:Fe-S cluster assembly ATP-binding protein
MLSLKNFSVCAQSTPIVRDITTVFKSGQLVIISGDNGSGKSTLACALMGLSEYTVSGEIFLEGNTISGWSVEKRAQAGIFLGFQHPIEVPGLPITTFLQHAYRSCHSGHEITLEEINQKIERAFELVGLPKEYSVRNVHEGFSGGQKKRFELVQMLVLEPRIIILDEPDSGLDAQGVSALITVIKQYREMHPEALIIIITHNTHFAEQFNADLQLTMTAGKLI